MGRQLDREILEEKQGGRKGKMAAKQVLDMQALKEKEKKKRSFEPFPEHLDESEDIYLQ